MSGEIAISDDPRAQKIYEGFRMCGHAPRCLLFSRAQLFLKSFKNADAARPASSLPAACRHLPRRVSRLTSALGALRCTAMR